MSSIIRPSIINNNPHQYCRWHGYASETELATAVSQNILDAARKAIEARHEFHLVLAGGTTPRRVYERLRKQETNWQAWHIYFGDERCLPVEHAERNSRMAAETLLNYVSIPAAHIHIIPAELGATAAADAYTKTLSKVTLFDLVLLGLGEDGHTASLFPHHFLGNTVDSPATLAIEDAPKFPANRVSLSAFRLSQTRQLFFMVSGSTKKQAVSAWQHAQAIPAAAITPESGVDIFLDLALL
jgi:6-phosphogluconolactonase